MKRWAVVREALRRTVGAVLVTASLFVLLPAVLLDHLERMLSGGRSERVFGTVKEILAVIPTVLGSYLRSTFYWATCRRVPPMTRMLLGSMIAHRDVRIGKGVVVGAFTIIGAVSIGDHVLIGSHCCLLSGRRGHEWTGDRWVFRIAPPVRRIEVGDRTWIGDHAVVMAPVGRNCVVAAGAVVYRRVPDGSIVAGNPARRTNYWEDEGAR